MSALLTLDVCVGRRIYKGVHVHGAGGPLADNRGSLARVEKWLANPAKHPTLRLYTKRTAVGDTCVEVETARTKIVTVHGRTGGQLFADALAADLRRDLDQMGDAIVRGAS